MARYRSHRAGAARNSLKTNCADSGRAVAFALLKRSGEGEYEMTLTSFLILLLVAGICGAIGQAIVGYSRGGCLVSIALGFIGALLGTWLAGALGLPEIFAVNIGGRPFPIIWSIIGSAIFVAILSLFTRRTYY
jgi:uncharacterized membrane protein YeaQ/YmgE (transglycosylase-associated protein family)